jgi:hypothetical protein
MVFFLRPKPSDAGLRSFKCVLLSSGYSILGTAAGLASLWAASPHFKYPRVGLLRASGLREIESGVTLTDRRIERGSDSQ